MKRLLWAALLAIGLFVTMAPRLTGIYCPPPDYIEINGYCFWNPMI